MQRNTERDIVLGTLAGFRTSRDGVGQAKPGLPHAIQPLIYVISLCPQMVASKKDVVVHKFGGASLDDGAAYRHAVAIVKGRPGAPVVVVSAPAGITDILLGLATRAVAG